MELQALASQAYYGSGIIHQGNGECAEARKAFEEALKLTTSADLKTRAQRRLDGVTCSESVGAKTRQP